MKRINISEDQLRLPFGEGRTRSLSIEDRGRFFWFMAGVSLLSLVVYFYAINATAHHLAIRQNLESEVSQIAVHLSTLEFASIDLKNNITLEVAHQYGFQEVKEPLYVSRGALHSLTLNTPVR